MRKKLTQVVVEKTAPPAAGEIQIFDTFTPGFAIRITKAGARSFVVRGRIRGRAQPITYTLGDAGLLTLSDARDKARDALLLMRDGIDPRHQAQPEEPATFDELLATWERLHLSQKRPRYATETCATIRKNLPDLLARPATDITRAEVVRALDKIVLEKPGAARNTLAYARSCFAWAQRRGTVPANPFSELPDAPAARDRERVLADDEIADLWVATDTLPYPFGSYFKLLTLTLQRRETVAAMAWSEITSDVWTIPGRRMKQGKVHVVHLAPTALAILENLPRVVGSDLVFTTTGESAISGFSRAKVILDRAIAKIREAAGRPPMAPWVPHDLRRTGVSKLAEMGFDSIVADMLLAHQPARLKGTAAIYQRHTFIRERAQALDAWAAHVGRVDVDNVVTLPGRAAQ